MINRCNSGGAEGSDLLFGKYASKAGHAVRHYTFKGAKTDAPTTSRHYLDNYELKAADRHLIEANETLGRTFPASSAYVNHLLQRNFYQIKDAEKVYAVAPIVYSVVQGGTAWAVQMAIDRGVPEIYVFDLNLKQWVMYEDGFWVEAVPPSPEGIYAGIGTRTPGEIGEEAIRDIYAAS